MLWVALALLGVMLSAWLCPQLLWWWCDEKKTRVSFWHLFMVIHVSPLSLPHWRASIVRVGRLMLRPGGLVPEPSSRTVLVSRRTETTTSASGVTTSMSPPVCGADAWQISPLGQNLQANTTKSFQKIAKSVHLMGLIHVLHLIRSVIHEVSKYFLIKTHLENSPPEQCLMQTNCAGHRVSIGELNICKAAKRWSQYPYNCVVLFKLSHN